MIQHIKVFLWKMEGERLAVSSSDKANMIDSGGYMGDMIFNGGKSFVFGWPQS